MSINGGKTDLAAFDTSSDPGDFARDSPVDPFNAYLAAGNVYSWTNLDNRLMDVLGYDVGGVQAFGASHQPAIVATGAANTGVVAGQSKQYANITRDSLDIVAQTPNRFIHGGSEEDQTAVESSHNLLTQYIDCDFLAIGSGHNDLFARDRHPVSDTWSNINSFGLADSATIPRITPNIFNASWPDGPGATGYTSSASNATAHDKPGVAPALTGFTGTNIISDRLYVSSGFDPSSGIA